MNTTTAKMTRQTAIRTMVAALRDHVEMTAELVQAIEVAENAATAWETAAEKRKNAPYKETATHKENVNLAMAIFHKMPKGETVTAKWIMENFPGIATGQKVGAVAKVAKEKQLWRSVKSGEYALMD